MTDLPTPSAWRYTHKDRGDNFISYGYSTEQPKNCHHPLYTPMFTQGQMNQYGQACFEEGREAMAMAEPCIGKDPRCPCQDGDACHYKDCGGTKALPVPVAQPAQEPVAFYHPHKGFYWAKPTHISAPTVVDVPPVPLYVKWKAAQRPWQGLTGEEVQFYTEKHSKLVNAGYDKVTDTNLVAKTFDSTGFYKEVSTVLKERNNG